MGDRQLSAHLVAFTPVYVGAACEACGIEHMCGVDLHPLEMSTPPGFGHVSQSGMLQLILAQQDNLFSIH